MHHAEMEQQIAELGKRIAAKKEQKYRYQARYEELERVEQQVLKELQELGANPETVDREVAELEAEVEALLAEINALLPAEG
jgi:chromosome segregation ATPase